MTRRTLLGSVLILAAVIAVVGALSVAIDRQHRAALRAQRSLAVIAAANLTQQRLLAVQTNLRGYLIRGNEDLLSAYRVARAALPDATYDLQALVAGDPPQMRRAPADPRRRAVLRQRLRRHGDRPHARGRRGRGARLRGRRRRARAGGLVAGADLGADRRRAGARSARARLPRPTVVRTARCWIAIVGLAVCVLVLVLATWFVARRVVQPVGRLAAAADRVRRGDFSVDVPERGSREIARLGASFNAMARSLEESRDELESQNTELEVQAITLEERQEELVARSVTRSPPPRGSWPTRSSARSCSRPSPTGSPGPARRRRWRRWRWRQLAAVGGRRRGRGVGRGLARSGALGAARRCIGLEPVLAGGVRGGARGGGERAGGRLARGRRSCEDGTLRVHGLAGPMTVRWEAPRTADDRRAGGRRGGAGRRQQAFVGRGERAGAPGRPGGGGAGRGERAGRARLALAGQRGRAGRRARGDRADRPRSRARVRQRRDVGAGRAALAADRRRRRHPRRRSGAGRGRSGGLLRGVGDDPGRLRRADRGRAAGRGRVAGALHGAGGRRGRLAHRPAGDAARRHPRARRRAAQDRPDGDRLARAAHAAGVACWATPSCCARGAWSPRRATRSSAPCTARPSGSRR